MPTSSPSLEDCVKAVTKADQLVTEAKQALNILTGEYNNVPPSIIIQLELLRRQLHCYFREVRDSVDNICVAYDLEREVQKKVG